MHITVLVGKSQKGFRLEAQKRGKLDQIIWFSACFKDAILLILLKFFDRALIWDLK